MIPRIDAKALFSRDRGAVDAVRRGVADLGFLVIHNTPIPSMRVKALISEYRAFFAMPATEKAQYDMARTGSNRGWGATGSEQVDPDANPDYKQVFDCGLELDRTDPLARLGLRCYAPNLWPAAPVGFAPALKSYYRMACLLSLDLLNAIAGAIGEDADYFADKFTHPMALLRGNFYPERPAWATEKDFGIATHTDYGCLTLLATDGSPGLEVRTRGGGWMPVSAPPGEFIINFGEMLEMWTAGRVRATPHRVRGTKDERISVPLFFNPKHDANVAPIGSGRVIRAVDHLQKRYDETYVHLQSRKALPAG